MLSSLAGVLFDGFAYGMLLFLLSVGLSVTLGMMNFVNLAHCSFAMVGGYYHGHADEQASAGRSSPRCRWRSSRRPSYPSFSKGRCTGACTAPADLDQCLLTIGIVFISVAAFAWFYTTEQQSARVPEYLRGSVQFMGISFAVYRMFLIAVSSCRYRPAGDRAGTHPLRRSGARGGGQPAHGARPRHRRRPRVHVHLRARRRPRRSRRRARHRGDRPRSRRSR